MKGRKPKPMHLKLIDGNTGHRPDVPSIIVDGELGEAPAWFSAPQRLKWDHVMRSAPPGMLKELDRQIVVQYCVAAALFDECAQQMAERGGPCVLSEKGNPYQSPYVSIMNQQAVLCRQYIPELGFSPTSRARVKAPRAKTTVKNKFSDLKKLSIE